MDKSIIDIHVDDFGISRNASKDILDMIRLNKVNSISVIPNFSCFMDCMKELKVYLNENQENHVKISTHINLMEGKPCSDIDMVRDLVDEKGYFKLTWGSLLVASYNPLAYRKLKNQLKIEISKQIASVVESLPSGCPVRIDSHQHTHAIPIVYRALIEVIEEEKLNVTYFRDPGEPIFPYLTSIKIIKTYSVVNIIKNILLNMYSLKIKNYCNKHNFESPIMWGVVMSGKMDYERVSILLDRFFNLAKKKKKNLEILFHGGSVKREELTEEYTKLGFVTFHLSPNRSIEKEAILKL